MDHPHEAIGTELLNDTDAPEMACGECGSPDVELPDWTDPNRQEITGGMDSGPRDGYCCTCQTTGGLFWVPGLSEEDAAGDLAERVAAHAPEWRALIARNHWGRAYRPDESTAAPDPPSPVPHAPTPSRR